MSAFAVFGDGSDYSDTDGADPPRDTGDGDAEEAPDLLAAALEAGAQNEDGQAVELLLSSIVATYSPTPEDGAEQGVRIIDGEADGEMIAGIDGPDMIGGRAGDDTFSDGVDDDEVRGGSGADTLRGGAGADALQGGLDDDHLEGGMGADTLAGGHGHDTLTGIVNDPGTDRIDAGHQAEIVDFSAGDDMLVVPYDGAAGPAPDVSLAPDAEDPASQRLLLGGVEIAHIANAAGLTPALVALLPQTDLPGIGRS